MEERFGGFWRRTMAFLTDEIILFFISVVVLFAGMILLYLGFPSHFDKFLPGRIAELAFTFMVAYNLTTVVVSMLYFTYFHGTTGQTPGKIIFGLRVVQSTGQEMTLGLGFLRWVGYIISSMVFCFGFIWVAFDVKKQGWHDKIAGTVVVRVENIVDGHPYQPDDTSTT